MVGFKLFTLWTIIIASLAITGCVPQSKQTECGPNEAFSPSQRRCLPVNPSETSFIKIKSPVPTGGITSTASTGSSLAFTIMVENPYNRPYRVRWIKNFNGTQTTIFTPSAPSSVITDHPYTISLTPNTDLFGAVGNHIITAQLLDATSNTIIDSHDFSLQLTNDPTPNGQSFTPGLSLPLTYNPINTTRVFSFNVLNNGRVMNTPLVRWRLVKLTGTSQPDLVETTPLINTNHPQLVDYTFNPANPLKRVPAPIAPFTDYIGNYRLEASIMDGATTFSTYSWEINIIHPELGFIMNAHLPVPGNSNSTVRAFNGVPYYLATPVASNFSFGGTTRSEFCVQVSDPDGRYGNGVTVRYYLGNDTGHVYEGITSSSDDQICLSDAPIAVQNAVVFSNANPDLTWSTSITAKVFDTQTGEEYSRYDAGNYPLVWNVQVEPQNRPPVLTFVDTGSSVACGTTVGNVRNNCEITQDNGIANNILRVAFSIQDEHNARVAYTARLTRGATTVDSSCQKAFADPHLPVFTCEFRVPAHDTLGSIDPTLDQWRVNLEVIDENSPYTSAQKTSSLIWNLNVREINYRPEISAVNTYLNTTPTTTFTEKDTAIFQVQLDDPEKDEYIIQLARCNDATLDDSVCTNLMTTTRTYLNHGDYNTNRRLAYTIPDGFLPANVLSDSVIFRIKVINYASTPDAVTQTPNEAISSITLTINNHNPAPFFTHIANIDIVAPTVTDPIGIDYFAFGSFPLTLDPGTVKDDSEFAPEGNITYQWWIAPHSVTPTWSQISGATSRVLSWTPGTNMSSGNYLIKLCITDGYPTRDSVDPNLAGTYCNDPAAVTVYNNFLSMNPVTTNIPAEGQFIVGAPAVWIDTSPTGVVSNPLGTDSRIVYSAFVVENLATENFKVHVQKSAYNIDGTGEMRRLAEISFDAIDPLEQTSDFVIFDVKDIRLVGDENSLYIAYLANFENTYHNEGYKPEIRKIYKGLDRGEKTTPNIHKAPFAFNYEGFFVNHSQPSCLNCWGGGSSASNLQVVSGSIILETTNLLSGTTISLGYEAGVYPLAITATGVDSTDLAINVTAAINAHPEAGFTAVHSGGDSVTIYGPFANEDARVQYITNKLGQIWVDNNYLYVPFINLSAAAPNNKIINIEFVQNLPAQNLYTTSLSGMNTIALSNTFANDFDNAIDRDGNLIIAYADNASAGNLIKFSGVNTATGVNYPILGSKNVQKIRLAANNATNNFYYVMAQAGDQTIALTRLEANLGTADFTRIWSFTQTGTSDTTSETFFTDFSTDGRTVYDFAIQAAQTDTYAVSSIAEARILITSSLGVHAFKTLANNTVSCGSCQPVSQVGSVISPHARLIGVSNILANQTIATTGNVSPANEENKRDIMAFTYVDDSVLDQNILRMGIINTERIQINSTTRNPNGYFTPAAFKY